MTPLKINSKKKTNAVPRTRPIKGKTGVIAGIARTGGGRDASVGNTEGNEASPVSNTFFGLLGCTK